MEKDKLAKAQKELEALKEKYGMEFQISLDFPRYRELPDELQLALKVVFKENPQFLVNLALKPQKENDDTNAN